MQQSSLSNQEKQKQPDAGSGDGIRTSTSASSPPGNQLATYKFELLDSSLPDYKFLRLTYLGDGSFYNRSVNFRINANHPLVTKLKGSRDHGRIIKEFLFRIINEFIQSGSRIDDDSIKQFFSKRKVKINTTSHIPMSLLKEIIRTKKSQVQSVHQGR